MGYYTRFTITTDKFVEPMKADLETISGGYSFDDSSNAYGFSGGYNKFTSDEIKWYDHEKHLIKISKLKSYKNVLISVNGAGEEDGDFWNKYFKNGKMVVKRGTIVYPEFNPGELD